MNKKLVVVVAMLATYGLACGDDEDDTDDVMTMETADSAGAMDDDTDTGASDSETGVADMAAMDGAPMAPEMKEPVACGSTTCAQPMGLSSLLGGFGSSFGDLTGALPSAEACCFDEAAGTCGLTAGMGTPCEEPAVADSRCPSVETGGFGSFLGGVGTGCCTEENMCGIDGSLFGRGCLENADAAMQLSSMGAIGTFLMIPGARGCDDPPLPSEMGTDMEIEMGDGMGVDMDADGGMPMMEETP